MHPKSTPRFLELPPEVRNQIYLIATLKDGFDFEQRKVLHVHDGHQEERTHGFYIDQVNSEGQSELYKRNMVHVTQLSSEILSLVMPRTLFTFRTVLSLSRFSQQFAAHAKVWKIVPAMHIECEVSKNFTDEVRNVMGAWEEIDGPHGGQVTARSGYDGWFKAINTLPQGTTVHFVFSELWRDFRAIRSLCIKHNICKYKTTFRFTGQTGLHPKDYDFCVRNTIAAIVGQDADPNGELSREERDRLVRHGCRGFNFKNSR